MNVGMNCSLSPTRMSVTKKKEQQRQTVKRKKKCHENRKRQRFKQKCQVRGLNGEDITAPIHKKDHTIAEPSLTDQTIDEQIQ